jgi:hypothetical protein
MQTDLQIEIRDLRPPTGGLQNTAAHPAHLRTQNTAAVQYLRTASAQYLGRGIPKQSLGRQVPGKDLTLFVHTENGISCPFQEGKQLVLEHPKVLTSLALTCTNRLSK